MRGITVERNLTILFLLFFPFLCIATTEVKLSTPYGSKATIGQPFYIQIEANTAGPINLKKSDYPNNVSVVYTTPGEKTEQSVYIDNNGKTINKKTTHTLTLTCKGEDPGIYTYGPIEIDGVKSNTIKYEVTEKSSSPYSSKVYIDPMSSFGFDIDPSLTDPSLGIDPSTYDPTSGPIFVGKGNEEMFLIANVNKSNVYEQEAIEYTVTLYTTYQDINFLGAAASPKFEGFLMEESSDLSQSFSAKEYKGKLYKALVIAKYIIFPQKSGKLQIKGNTYTVSTNSWSLFYDPYLYYGSMISKNPVQLNVTPNDIEIDVKELPKPIPANFMGGVGNFSITSSMPSTNLATNTPASYQIKIEGSGNIKYIKLPEISPYFPSSTEVFTPDVKTDTRIANATVTGTSIFNYLIVSKETGNYEIPGLEFTYFDPVSATYKTLHTSNYSIHVDLGKESDKSQKTLWFNSNLMPIGNVSKELKAPYIYSGSYWLWYILSVTVFIVCLVAYRKYLKDHEDLTQLRSKQANKMALKRLSKAYQCYKDNKEEEFYNEMLSALWGYLSDKLKMPTSELNRNNVNAEFKNHGVNESTFMPIITLIDECEYAKYTPVSREANMRQLYSDAITTLANVENEYQEETKKKNANEDSMSGETENHMYINTTAAGADRKSDDLTSQENHDNA